MSSRGEGVEQLRSRRDQIKAELAGIEDFRPGSLVARYRRCGKQGCHCARPEEEGHGPSWSLTCEVGGKTVIHVIAGGCRADPTSDGGTPKVPELGSGVGRNQRATLPSRAGCS